jgi:O-succinylbenzoic acid--CoA ligase
MAAVPELIAVALPAGPTFVEAMRRIHADGDAILPIDPRLPPPAVAHLLDSLRPAAVLDEHGERHRRPDGGIPTRDGDAVVIATSGSTGSPKGVVHTHSSIAAMAVATSRVLGVDPATDRWLCCLPLSHVAGLSVVQRALHLDVPLEVHPAFDAAAVTDAAARGATLTTLVPTALARIDPAVFRRIVVGGAAPPAVLPPNAVVSYGMTETGSAFVYDGRPLQDVELRVVDGEIQVRGPMLLRAYRGAAFAPEGFDPKDADGWFATDDAGELAPDGSLVVHGRRGDLVITGGENVWPVEVERVLSQHPGVAEVAVVGRPDDEWGARVVAVVVATDPALPPTLDELRAHTKAELPAFAAPREVEVVEALPRTLLGKVERKAL